MGERRNGRTALSGRLNTRIDGIEWSLAGGHPPIAARTRRTDAETQGEVR